ncbi:MAG: SAM-dependent methyltransferase [Chitinophagia bacterium]|jgi:SAM-dependent methyltransferase|nr:SAM-dependent methyltransferase [Chitinophagia bacterium]
MSDQLHIFINHVLESISDDTFASLSLMNKRDKSSELRTLRGKLIEIKKGLRLSLVFRYETNDITKNFEVDKIDRVLNDLLTKDFFQAILSTTHKEYHLSQKANKANWKLTIKEAKLYRVPERSHDKTKNRLIKADKNAYLHGLEISTQDGNIRKDKQDKYRQINKFIELIDNVLKPDEMKQPYRIVDMGAGKGYLSFALYDHLSNNLDIDLSLEAIELRGHLVRNGNELARAVGFDGLVFKEGAIENTPLKDIDMVIALHACDTATDDAIFRGIKSGAEVIVCSPCCHKQVRKQMEANEALSVITKHGILKERQAEIVTDTIRALMLEAYGYQTRVMEFIATDHTPKNLLITAVKKTRSGLPIQKYLDKVEALKKQFGIEKQQLQQLLGS